MTEVMNSLEPGTEDFLGGGAGGDEVTQTFSDSHQRFPKLSKRLPSIVVEPTDGAEVESGELRWPPDEPGSPDAPPERPRDGEQGGGAEEEEEPSLSVQQEEEEEEASGAEMHDSE